MTSGPSCSEARAAPRSSPPSSAPGSRISPCCAGPIYPRRLWRRWTPSFWTPGSWRAVAADGTATAICVRCPRPSASASAGNFAAGMKAAGSTLPWASSPSSVWSGIPSSWCRCTITVCRRKSAPAAAPTILAACSATSTSLWANFPAQHRGTPGGLRGGQELLRLLS